MDKALLSEDALALRFSEETKDSLRFIALKNRWPHWDGTRWRPESTLLAYDLARASVRDAVGPDSRFKKASVIAAVERMARVDRRQATELSAYNADT